MEIQEGMVFMKDHTPHVVMRRREHRRIDFHRGEFLDPEPGWVVMVQNDDKTEYWLSDKEIEKYIGDDNE